MLLNIFEIFKENMSSGVYNTIPISYVYVFIIATITLIIFLLFIILFPLFKRSPEKLYRRYLFLREEMAKVDDKYSKKKLLYTEYLSMQFLNMQEFYDIIKKLKEIPEYKTKLQNYTFKNDFKEPVSSSYVPIKKPVVKLTEEESNKKQVEKLVTILKPKVNLYTKEDVYGVLIAEGFSKEITENVLTNLSKEDVKFSNINSSSLNKKELSLSIDNFFDGTRSTTGKSKTSYSIFDKPEYKKDIFKDDFKTKEMNLNKIEDVESKVKKDKEVIDNPSFMQRIKSIFKKKEEKVQVHSADEIDNIFKNIEKELKNKDY